MLYTLRKTKLWKGKDCRVLCSLKFGKELNLQLKTGGKLTLIKFNKKQKNVLIAALFIIIVSIVLWLAYGGEIFTKSQVLVEVKDEVFDTTYKEWRDKFIWGLDLTLAISGITTVISAILLFLFRTKKQIQE